MLMGSAAEARQCLSALVWLDGVMAKARFGRWLGCEYPEFVEWGTTQGVAKAKRGRKGEQVRGDTALRQLG